MTDSKVPAHASTGARPSASSAEDREPADPRFSLEFLDPAASPATDFYRFAAGRWLDANPVPADKVRWSAFDLLVERNFRLLRRILEEAAAADPTTNSDPSRRLVGDFYASATDRARRDSRGHAPLGPDLALVERLAERGQLGGVLGAFHRRGIDVAFRPAVFPDKRNSTVYAFYAMQGGLSLPDRDYYLLDEFAAIRAELLRHIERTLGLLGGTAESARADAASILAFETDLAKAGRSRADLRDEERNYNRFERAELLSQFPASGWTDYLAAAGVGTTPYIVLGQPEFFAEVDRQMAERPLTDWTRYLRWHAIRNGAPFLSSDVEDEHFDFFSRRLRGQETPEPEWRRAAVVIDGLVGEALGRLYVERHFPAAARARALELVEDLRAVFRDRLVHLPWMSPVTRGRALEKFSKFGLKIGHPERYRDYGALRVERDEYFENVRRALTFEFDRDAGRVGGPVDRDEWGMTPPTVNAYYDPTKNEIVFPAGILQPPFFDPDADDAINYGGIGAVIGHEITHGYDDQGRKYDGAGNLTDWWTPSDTAEFSRRARRVVEQYSRFEALPGVFVNGELTLGENIADLGGVSIAFDALRRKLARTGGGPIDGYTPEQRFFLAWAQIWRQNCRDAEARRRIAIDPHSPGRFRAVGAVENAETFRSAFGQPLTPKDQSPSLEIW